MKCPLRFMVEEARKSKKYPVDVKKFLHGLYAVLHLTDNATAKDMEKMVFYAYRSGYVLGAASMGADAQKTEDRFPDFGLDDESEMV